jgi:hypothetical protein
MVRPGPWLHTTCTDIRSVHARHPLTSGVYVRSSRLAPGLRHHRAQCVNRTRAFSGRGHGGYQLASVSTVMSVLQVRLKPTQRVASGAVLFVGNMLPLAVHCRPGCPPSAMPPIRWHQGRRCRCPQRWRRRRSAQPCAGAVRGRAFRLRAPVRRRFRALWIHPRAIAPFASSVETARRVRSGTRRMAPSASSRSNADRLPKLSMKPSATEW